MDPFKQLSDEREVPLPPSAEFEGEASGPVNVGLKEYRKARFAAIMVPVIMVLAAIVGGIVFWISVNHELPARRILIVVLIPFVLLGGYFYKTAGLLKTRPYQKFKTELLVEKFKNRKKSQ